MGASGHTAASWMADMLSTAAWLVSTAESERLQEEGRAGGSSEGAGGLAARAGKGGEGLARGEAGDDGVAYVDDAEAAGLAIVADALVHVEQRVAGMTKLEADRAREQRARRQKQQRAEPRG